MSGDKTQIYLRIDGREMGPFTVEEVKDMINEGTFRPFDFIRTGDKKRWMRAENLVHLKRLFQERNKEAQKGSFGSWIDAVKSGKTEDAMALTASGAQAERKRLEAEKEKLEGERKRLEQEEAKIRVADEEREDEMRDLIEERQRLEGERRRIEEEEAELLIMGESVKKRRRIPIIVAAILTAAIILISIPSYIFLVYIPGEKARKAEIAVNEKLEKLSELESEIALLTNRLNTALTTGDIETAKEIQEELDKKLEEKEELAADVGSSETPIKTSSGTAKLGGLLRAEGVGAEDPNRSAGAIASGISGQMGPVRSTYSRELKSNPGISGQVIVGFNVNTSGAVTQANVVSGTIGNSAVESACVGAVRNSNFGSAEGDARCTFKFDFSP